MKKNLLSLLLSLVMSPAALAESAPGYWSDASGKVIRNAAGECWRAGYWTPAMAIAECDPGLVGKPEPVKVAAPTPPVPVAPPPAPTPEVEIPVAAFAAADPTTVRVKAAPTRIALESSASFALGKAELSPTGRKNIDRDVLGHLDQFATVAGITIVGHTDPLGTPEGNVKLSKARADAVKSYLVGKGVSPDLIKTDGVGSSQPFPGVECSARLPRGKLAECLAPHRRIEIDVAGEAQ